jgi:hypothetical protein
MFVKWKLLTWPAGRLGELAGHERVLTIDSQIFHMPGGHPQRAEKGHLSLIATTKCCPKPEMTALSYSCLACAVLVLVLETAWAPSTSTISLSTSTVLLLALVVFSEKSRKSGTIELSLQYFGLNLKQQVGQFGVAIE